MQIFIYITQLPEYRHQIVAQLDALDLAEGFTLKDKTELKEIYFRLLAKIDEVLNEPEDTDVIYIDNDDLVPACEGSYNELQPSSPVTSFTALHNIQVVQPEHLPGYVQPNPVHLLYVDARNTNDIPVNDPEFVNPAAAK